MFSSFRKAMDGIWVAELSTEAGVITYKIKRDVTVKRERYITVLQNPYRDAYDTKVLYASKVEGMERKVQAQLKKWRDKQNEQGKYKIQEQSTGKEDSEISWW